MIYFVIFGISACISILSDYYIQKSHLGKKDVRVWFFAFIAITVVSILNGIRDYSIGTDIQVYGNSVFIYAAQSHSLTQFLDLCVNSIGMTEYGYALLNYIVARFSTSPHVFYLILGILTNSLVYWGITRMQKFSGIPLAWLTYLLVFYPSTLNLLRQSLAIAIIFVMCTYAFDKRYKLSVILIILAYTMHHSAILGFYLLFFIWLLQRKQDKKRHTFYLIIFSFLTASLYAIISWLNSTGYIQDKYSQYITIPSESISLANSILIRIPFIILILFILANNSTISLKQQILYIFIIGEILLLPLQLISATAFRISLYFGIFKILVYPNVLKEVQGLTFTKNAIYIAFLLFYFIWQIIIQGSNEVYPFVIANDLSLF
ncbi:EpsG family protein [Bifidobacterium cebidarum]|uniref:Brp/Blh family beta-carotene 15,15'-monooxygenase n=1 Tax=Bifidobacterium cebidarum TaxID=2650773 RepID=A0A6I1GBS5_9BIFI|nr:EpsG family protein [Bifidobacterium cebidarum]KAB7788132.1 brp/Blh family beta-carotene 15,15'-monooxygenase [Bifidobacterium cebidarum]